MTDHDPLCPNRSLNHYEVHGLIAKVRADERAKCPSVEIDAALGEPTTCKVWLNGDLIFHGVDLSSTYRSVAVFDLDEGPVERVVFVEAPEDTQDAAIDRSSSDGR